MHARITRRRFAWLSAALFAASRRSTSAQETTIDWCYPMGLDGGTLGDGCGIFHGYACENIPFFPGLWHTGENWHLTSGETAGTPVAAVADGEVVYAGADYPGLVIIVAHDGGLFSMYGHLNFDAPVAEGDRVQRGQQIGSVLQRADGRLSHLHFEIRSFFMSAEVNGDAPRHTFNCGYDCPPGPGYWPMSDPDHPSVMGWRNPTRVIGTSPVADDAEVIVSSSAGASLSLWSAPHGVEGATRVGELPVGAGDRFRLLEVDAGDPAGIATSATGYHLWYHIEAQRDVVWVQAAVPSARFTGSDGRPSSVRLRLLPDRRVTV
jgi:hypothetical protein